MLYSVLRSPWFVDAQFAHSQIPFIQSLIEGKPLSNHFTPKVSTEIEPIIIGCGTANYMNLNSFSVSKIKDAGQVVAVIDIDGPILKSDAYCGPEGTETMRSNFKKAMQLDNVLAVVFKISSPGGQASMIGEFANEIFEAKKPVLTHVNEMAASAGWYLAAPSKEIYCDSVNDVVGSTGVMCSFMDIRPALEKQGVVFHEIYSNLSTQKNKTFKDALTGDYSGIQKEMLDPLATIFRADIKKFRPAITDKNVFEGATFRAESAMEMGMIDGFKTFDEVVERAYELGIKNFNENQNSNNIMEKKFVNINAALNIDDLVIDANGSYLNVDQLQELDSIMAQSEGLSQQITALGVQIEESTVQIASLNEEIANIGAQNITLTERIAVLEAENITLGGGAKNEDLDTEEDFQEEKKPVDGMENYTNYLKKKGLY